MIWFKEIISRLDLLFEHMTLSDLLDLIIIWFIIYKSLFFIHRSGAIRLLFGAVFFVALYFISTFFDFITLKWFFEWILSNGILILLVLFQSELKQALVQIGNPKFYKNNNQFHDESEIVDELVRALNQLTRWGHGALIVLEKDIDIDHLIEKGTTVDGRVTGELILSIFDPSSPLHDGAVIIRHQKIAYAGSFLPLTHSQVLDRNWGTRHRAALGLTERTDSVVFVVSEEQKTISLVKEGQLTPIHDEKTLRQLIYDQLA